MVITDVKEAILTKNINDVIKNKLRKIGKNDNVICEYKYLFSLNLYPCAYLKYYLNKYSKG